MTTPIINVIIDQFALYILPPLIAFVWTLAVVYVRKAAEKLPSSVRKVLWDYANTVVKSIMQQAKADWTDEQKKQYAIDQLEILLQRAHIIVPDELIEHVIEQVIFEVKKDNPPEPPAPTQLPIRAAL